MDAGSWQRCSVRTAIKGGILDITVVLMSTDSTVDTSHPRTLAPFVFVLVQCHGAALLPAPFSSQAPSAGKTYKVES